MTATESDPIVIVGSRLQILIFWVSAIALPIGLWPSVGWLSLIVAGLLTIAGAIIAARRYELGPEGIRVRRITGTRRADDGTFAAQAGHRYLRILFNDGTRTRIEVPVEIRPDVRDWAALRPPGFS